MTNKSAYKFSMDRRTSVCLRFLSFSGIMYGIYPMRAGTAVYSSLFAVTTINYPNRGERKHGKRSVPVSTHSPHSPDRIPTIITSSTVCAPRDEWRTLTTFHLRFNLPGGVSFYAARGNYASERFIITPGKIEITEASRYTRSRKWNVTYRLETSVLIDVSNVSRNGRARGARARALSFPSTSNSFN